MNYCKDCKYYEIKSRLEPCKSCYNGGPKDKFEPKETTSDAQVFLDQIKQELGVNDKNPKENGVISRIRGLKAFKTDVDQILYKKNEKIRELGEKIRELDGFNVGLAEENRRLKEKLQKTINNEGMLASNVERLKKDKEYLKKELEEMTENARDWKSKCIENHNNLVWGSKENKRLNAIITEIQEQVLKIARGII